MKSIAPGQVVLEALEARHSAPRVLPERPPRDLIESIIAAACWAPNHHRTEPWRFTVLTGSARDELGFHMAEALRRRLRERSEGAEIPDELRAALHTERRKPLRAPVVVAVAAVPSDHPNVVEIEEIEACAAAVQNMLLAAEAVGLGAMWRTGKAAYDPAIKRFLGFPDGAHLVAFVYLGYPDRQVPRPRERRCEEHTTWRGWQ